MLLENLQARFNLDDLCFNMTYYLSTFLDPRYKDFFFDATQAERIRRAVLREGLRLSLDEENEDSDPETPSKRSRLYNEGENVDSQTHELFWACFEESAIEQPEPTEKQSKNATAQEIAKYTALAKDDRKINPYEWWVLSTNKNGFPILTTARILLIQPPSRAVSCVKASVSYVKSLTSPPALGPLLCQLEVLVRQIALVGKFCFTIMTLKGIENRGLTYSLRVTTVYVLYVWCGRGVRESVCELWGIGTNRRVEHTSMMVLNGGLRLNMTRSRLQAAINEPVFVLARRRSSKHTEPRIGPVRGARAARNASAIAGLSHHLPVALPLRGAAALTDDRACD
ncbi:hypothetical protein EVAR_67056_1 [Eumeta japonica]|uniref:HAT C-terminal dimerisation domain-containing protein n=1 Tax=Eumeta variegata TaxID=151549 RepID=A0A4C1ZKY7_EUMVA|nr:hypothetical protein EVAR_67056_1 [Eumeta japonica]